MAVSSTEVTSHILGSSPKANAFGIATLGHFYFRKGGGVEKNFPVISAHILPFQFAYRGPADGRCSRVELDKAYKDHVRDEP